MAHDFAQNEIRPVAWEYDKDGTWPEDVLRKAWELGLMNSHLPEEYGGPGLSYLEGCLIEEEIGWGCSGIGTSIACNGLATAPIGIGGSDALKKKYLSALTEDFKLASFCLTEPDAGSDVSGMRTTAVKKGDKLGQRASNTATITFNDVEVPAENMLGDENKGFKLAMMTLDRTRPGVAAMAVGIARAAF